MSQSNQRAGRRPGGRRGGPGGRSGRSTKPSNSTPVAPLHPTENPPDIESFAEFDLDETVQQAITAMGIVKPTPIQALATIPVLEGKDVIAKAETGTGKTLAFGAPMISKIDAGRSCVLGLVLTPTRELAEQVATVLKELGEARDIKVALIVGGEPAGPQVAALQKGAQIVVGTPGRVIDLYEQKFLGFPWTEFVVLDEADEMLEIGFIDDVKKILQFTPDERQTLLFSATFPDALLRLARDYTTDPAEIATASGIKTVDNIEQQYINLGEDERALALIRMIERSNPEDVFLIFCERRTDVERLMRRLERLSFSVKALHGGYDQSARFRVMSAFRTGEVKALVATDVASRGLDVKHVTRVVNFSPPRSITAYTHRIGRTGRAGRQGHAVTLVSPPNRVRWNSLLRDASWEITEVDAPGSRFSRGRSEAPERDSSSERGSRSRRPERDSDDDRAPREERPRRSREEREERPARARRDEEDRPRRSSRSEEREEGAREESRSRRPLRRPPVEDGPVELPEDRQVRRRDPNDPPRRARLTGQMRERVETSEEQSSPSRSRRDRDEERPRRSERSDEERPPRSSRSDEDRPRRSERSDEDRPRRSQRSDEDRPSRSERSDEDRPSRSQRSDGDRPRRSRRDTEARYEEQPDSENRPARLRPDEVDQPRRSQRDEGDRPRRSRRDSEERPARSRRDEEAPAERTSRRRDSERTREDRSAEEPRRPRRRSESQRDDSRETASQSATPAPSKPQAAPEQAAPRASEGAGGFGSGV